MHEHVQHVCHVYSMGIYGNLLTLEYLTCNCILASHIHTLDIRPAVNANFLNVFEVQFLKYGMPDLANRDVKYEFFC